ncbi:nucleotidyltransferase family protein [Geobacter benzoatilyticus]|jgi:predicted nucleotidyltransferase|uniref:Nucleotidyltransferase family protein n=1 Tax=Geobacter benzoatilyticus TaxID=2815309 RepID=A0ABX7Q3X0_9BACT|nr:nucleotidyltransferase family protein [Geobacter benzoatilyticus]QSV45801.1 nucleotidyltransferase family protein [Geobacter benzoatilyticus]
MAEREPVTPFDDAIISFMARHGAKRVGVFGSYARGEARPDSDLDLIVWFSDPKSLLGMIRLERELSELVGVKIDLLTEGAISPYLIERIKRELKVIYQ